MNKAKIVSVLATAALLLSATPAFAASISNPLFSNGQTTIDATGGATVSGTFTLTVGPGEVVEWLRTQSDPSQPFVDTSVGGTLGYQEQVYTGIPFSVKVPPNTGTYYPTVQGAGAFGGNRAINGGDSVFPSSIYLSSSALGTIRVVANGSTGGGLYNGMDIDALIAALKAAGFTVSGPGSSTPANPNCPVPSYDGTNAFGVQTWLIGHGQAGPFAEVGVTSATGNWKSASIKAYNAALAACK